MHVAIFKPEGDSPVAGNRNTPQPSHLAFEWVESVPWQVDVPGFVRIIEVCQGYGDPICQVSSYSAWVVLLIESFQPSMTERSDHATTVPRIGTPIKYATTPCRPPEQARPMLFPW